MNKCAKKSLRSLVRHANFVLLLGGLTSILTGAVRLNAVISQPFIYFGVPGRKIIFTVILIGGFLIVFPALLGWRAFVDDYNKLLLRSYLCALGLLVILMGIAGTVAFVIAADDPSILENAMKKGIESYYTNNDTSVWDFVQTECCGVEGTKDWTHHLPVTCWHGIPRHTWETGCFHKVNSVKPLMNLIGITIMSLVGLAIFILIIAITLAMTMQRGSSKFR